MRLNRRRLPGRRLARPEPPATPPAPPPILDFPREEAQNGDSTEFAAGSVPQGSSSSSTVEMPAVPAEVVITGDGNVPTRLQFSCPCGAKLIATEQIYDKHSRCGMCQTVLLVNLVYDPETGSHEIVPFRVDPNSPL